MNEMILIRISKKMYEKLKNLADLLNITVIDLVTIAFNELFEEITTEPEIFLESVGITDKLKALVCYEHLPIDEKFTKHELNETNVIPISEDIHKRLQEVLQVIEVPLNDVIQLALEDFVTSIQDDPETFIEMLGFPTKLKKMLNL